MQHSFVIKIILNII